MQTAHLSRLPVPHVAGAFTVPRTDPTCRLVKVTLRHLPAPHVAWKPAGGAQHRPALRSKRRVVALAKPSSVTTEEEAPAAVSGRQPTPPEGGGYDGPGWTAVLPHVLAAAFANYCFGYHIGVLNGPLDYIAEDLGFAGDTLMQGVVVSTFLVGAFIGAFSGGPLSDKVGRKRTFQLDAIPLVLGCVLSATATSLPAMVLGRLLVGVGVGVNASLVPLYISEVAPTKYRGTLGSMGQIATCFGLISVLLIGSPVSEIDGWWRTMFWLGTIPGVLLAGGMTFAAETPRWLAKVGRMEEAEETIRELWGPREVEEAMVSLRAAADEAESSKEGEVSWGELFSERYFKVVSIGSILFILQQFAGINGVLYFSSSTFREAGIGSAMLASAAVAVSNLIGALVALYLMDKAGRRICFMGSYGGMAVSMAILVAALTIPQLHDSGAGPILSVVGTLAYVFTFALGAGPATAMLLPEIFNTRIRAKAMAVSLCVHWVCNYAIGLFFLQAVELVGVPAIYGFFAAVSLGAVAYIYNEIPETKGRSLEDIERELLGPAKSS